MMAINHNMQMADVYTDGQGLSTLRLAARKNSPEATKAVAKQFEALFLQMMLKSMRANTGEGLFDSEQGKMYMDLFDKQIALKMSKNGTFGMAQVLEKQLNRDAGHVPKIDKTPLNANPLSVPKRTLPVMQMHEGLKARIKQQVTKLMQHANVAPTAKTADASKTQYFENPLQFAKAIWADVKTTARKLGVSPTALLAQSILETGWGKHIAKNSDGSSSNNIFGIKKGSFWAGAHTVAKTSEFVQGKKITLNQTFRSYSNPGQSLGDYAKLLQNNPQYKNVLKNGSTVAGFAKSMQASGYATDPEYGAKIQRIVKSPQFQGIMNHLGEKN